MTAQIYHPWWTKWPSYGLPSDSSPWCLKQVRSLIAQMIRQLDENEEKDHPR